MRRIAIFWCEFHSGDSRAERGAEAEAEPFAAAEVLVFETGQQPFPDVLDKRQDSSTKWVGPTNTWWQRCSRDDVGIAVCVSHHGRGSLFHAAKDESLAVFPDLILPIAQPVHQGWQDYRGGRQTQTKQLGISNYNLCQENNSFEASRWDQRRDRVPSSGHSLYGLSPDSGGGVVRVKGKLDAKSLTVGGGREEEEVTAKWQV